MVVLVAQNAEYVESIYYKIVKVDGSNFVKLEDNATD